MESMSYNIVVQLCPVRLGLFGGMRYESPTLIGLTCGPDGVGDSLFRSCNALPARQPKQFPCFLYAVALVVFISTNFLIIRRFLSTKER